MPFMASSAGLNAGHKKTAAVRPFSRTYSYRYQDLRTEKPQLRGLMTLALPRPQT